MPKNKAPQASQNVVAHSTRVAVVHQRSGPLPDPQELAAYNSVIPNGADRILQMAEAQSRHRMEIEKTVIVSQQSQTKRGQYFGLFAVLIAISCSTYAAICGMQTFASVLGGTTVVSLAGAFLGGKYLQRIDLLNKAKASPEPPPEAPK